MEGELQNEGEQEEIYPEGAEGEMEQEEIAA